MLEELQELGLSKNEATIYLYLLQHPSSTTGPIIKETKIVNSRIYYALHTLIEKGLVSYTTQKDGKHFSASNPQQFIHLAQQNTQKATSIVPKLQKITIEEEQDNQTKVYEGYAGFKTAFRQIIDQCKEGGTIDVISFTLSKHAEKNLRTFITNQNLRSAQKNITTRILVGESTKKTLGRDREKEANTIVRYVPSELVGPAAFDIIDDYVYIFLWGEKPYVYMIKNKAVAESFRKHFNFLWSIGKPAERTD